MDAVGVADLGVGEEGRDEGVVAFDGLGREPAGAAFEEEAVERAGRFLRDVRAAPV